MTDFYLYTDGGAELGVRAASAAIIADRSQESKLGVVAFLGGATNNEAEIVAVLLGLSCLRRLLSGKAATVSWISDSEYCLKSGTQYIKNWQKNGWKTADKRPVKNKGLWQAFLSLSSELDIVPEHIRGHSGHPENEACDAISTWAQGHGAVQLETEGESFIPDIGTGIVDRWLLLDGRSAIAGLRNEDPTDKHKNAFLQKFTDLGVNSLALVSAGIKEVRTSASSIDRDRIRLKNKIEEAIALSERIDEAYGREAAKSLKQLVAKLFS